MLHSQFKFAEKSLPELAIIAGNDAAYVYSRNRISEQIGKLRKTLPQKLQLHYSVKANSHDMTLAHIASQVDGLDVSSHQELIKALSTGKSVEHISFSGPGKSDEELNAAVASGISIHAESLNEIEKIVRFARKINRTPNIVLRVNPNIRVKQSGMVMGGGAQPFGIDLERIDEAVGILRHHQLHCAGLHCYTGSQMLNATLIIEMQAKILDMLIGLVNQHDLSNVSLNIGGGFGIPYFDRDSPLDLELVAKELSNKFEAISSSPKIRSIIIELGRFIVGESGIYIARVIEKKTSRGKQFAVVQGGMNHNLAASGNLGQIVRRNYPIAVSTTTSTNAQEKVTIVGPLCTPLDILASDILLPILEVGDFVAVRNSGAYGFSASPHKFLSHQEPREILL